VWANLSQGVDLAGGIPVIPKPTKASPDSGGEEEYDDNGSCSGNDSEANDHSSTLSQRERSQRASAARMNYTEEVSDVADSDEEGEDTEVLATPPSSSLDTPTLRATGVSKQVASQVSGCKVSDSGASDDGGAVRSSPILLDDEHLAKASNNGQYVLYVNNTPASDEGAEETFFILGLINMEPQWGDGTDDDNLYFHTQDMLCTEDSNWPQSLVDGCFHRPVAKKGSAPIFNWLDLMYEGTVVLALFPPSGLNADGRLKKPTRDRALAVLETHKKLKFIETFLAKCPEDRPRNKAARAPKPKRAAKRKRQTQ
jgi:hypothetical protein